MQVDEIIQEALFKADKEDAQMTALRGFVDLQVITRIIVMMMMMMGYSRFSGVSGFSVFSVFLVYLVFLVL